MELVPFDGYLDGPLTPIYIHDQEEFDFDLEIKCYLEGRRMLVYIDDKIQEMRTKDFRDYDVLRAFWDTYPDVRHTRLGKNIFGFCCTRRAQGTADTKGHVNNSQ